VQPTLRLIWEYLCKAPPLNSRGCVYAWAMDLLRRYVPHRIAHNGFLYDWVLYNFAVVSLICSIVIPADASRRSTSTASSSLPAGRSIVSFRSKKASMTSWRATTIPRRLALDRNG
jgi:hypothetical protein